MQDINIPIRFSGNNGIGGNREPITWGIPFPKGLAYKEKNIFLRTKEDVLANLQTSVLCRWADGSIKWLLCDFQADVGAGEEKEYMLEVRKEAARKIQRGILLKEDGGTLKIDTGCKTFNLTKGIMDGVNIVLTDTDGRKWYSAAENTRKETEGPLRCVVKFCGSFMKGNKKGRIDWSARLTFFYNKSCIRIDFTVYNPQRAQHKGGIWDLGDKGSVYFKDISFFIKTGDDPKPGIIRYKAAADGSGESYGTVRIYQESSGGENWLSHNHINRFGKVMNSFPGYRIYENNKIVGEGRRGQPVLGVFKGGKGVLCCIKNFWQNFPKAVESDGDTLAVRIFPKYYRDVFELQGGEQKTHTIYVDFGADRQIKNLDWVNNPLIPLIEPRWYSDSGVFGCLTPVGSDPNPKYQELVNCAVEGNNSFFNKREKIDEYGWRNFGCLYADHEAVRHKSGEPLVSHYNNQYDALNGFLLQFARAKDIRWHNLAEDLAYHTVDVDIYHTANDKPAYNGGLFWHTEHYTDAGKSTHRTYTKESLRLKPKKFCGGGPGNEHNYTTGLLNMYFFTGDPVFKEAVLGLADWVINMDDGSKTILRFLDKGPTGLASCTTTPSYHGPGRGAGNSINALIDAHTLSADKKYISKAEELIKRCVHPEADIEAQKLKDPEANWSYLVFFQAIGKYLDYKLELAETDYMYYYAKESLIHYAKWMYENEVPYEQLKDKVLIWTETWPAHDMRKSNVFDFAAKFSTEPWRSKFLQKAEYFYNSCLRDLWKYETKTFTRPLVILINYGIMRGCIKNRIKGFSVKDNGAIVFRPFGKFVSQRDRTKRKIGLRGA